MGIPELWDLLKPSFNKRISLDELVDQSIKERQRPPRVAIDAYLFIFQADHSSIIVEEKDGVLMQNVMAKILALVGLNISVILVFDGILKPLKLKSKENEGLIYEDELQRLALISNYSENNPFVEQLKIELSNNKIEYVQAPGEGEAQCAYLQKLGIVDYVISQDVDALVFGARRVLRNFSRFAEDIGKSLPKSSDITARSSYYVTPVDMNKVEQETGLTTSRLVFLASLRGGDYSVGAKKMGIVNAKNLALSGTSKSMYYTENKSKIQLKELQKSPQKCKGPPPDFANELIDCVQSKDRSIKLHPWDLRLYPEARRSNFDSLLKKMNFYLKEQNRDIFGRKVTFQEEFEFDEYYTMLYLFPLVSDQVPIFIPDTLGSGELKSDLHINLLEKTKVSRISNAIKRNYTQIVGEPIDELPEKQTHLFVPKYYTWSIKHIICKLITHDSDWIKVTNYKEENGLPKVMLKYDASSIFEKYPEIIEARRAAGGQPQSPGKNYIWVPQSLVEHYNPKLIDEYIESTKEKEYIKKYKSSPQKTTLDSLEVSPIKKSTLKGPVPFELKPKSPRKLSPNKSTSLSPRKRSKSVLLPGQKQLDFFLVKQNNKENAIKSIPELKPNDKAIIEDNPFLDSFNSTKEDERNKDNEEVMQQEEEKSNPIEKTITEEAYSSELTFPTFLLDRIFLKDSEY